MNENGEIDKNLEDQLIRRFVYEIKKISKDRNGNDYKLSERIKKVLEEEVK
jgi:hypothetical protein